MIESILNGTDKLHFVGIGGSGIFPIVEIFHGKGYTITGSDNNYGDNIALEEKMGIHVTIGHDSANITGAGAVIYSAAIPDSNPELVAARAQNIPLLERAQVLGYLTRQHEMCVCVCGTHGKTSTTAMLTQILLGAGLDPTAVIGGKLPLIGGNGRFGKTGIMTCEACEYKNTYHSLSPAVAIILNVDADHLEYFGNIENIIKSFHTFAQKASKSLIVNGDDANTMLAVSGINKPIITFGFQQSNNFYPLNIVQHSPTQCSFGLIHDGQSIANITLNVPGRHNILNAIAACAGAIAAGALPSQLAQPLSEFGGAGRRFELLGKTASGAVIADDYAHHPAELAVTLGMAGKMGYKNVWAVFQPFTFSRTKLLLDDFATSLAMADKVVLSPIMGGREENTYGIYSSDLAAKIQGSVCCDNFQQISQYVTTHAGKDDLILTLGCGDVYKCAKLMIGK